MLMFHISSYYCPEILVYQYSLEVCKTWNEDLTLDIPSRMRVASGV